MNVEEEDQVCLGGSLIIIHFMICSNSKNSKDEMDEELDVQPNRPKRKHTALKASLVEESNDSSDSEGVRMTISSCKSSHVDIFCLCSIFRIKRRLISSGKSPKGAHFCCK